VVEVTIVLGPIGMLWVLCELRPTYFRNANKIVTIYWLLDFSAGQCVASDEFKLKLRKYIIK